MYCQNCGKQIPDGSTFCTECGASQVATSQPMQFSAPPIATKPKKKKKTALWIILGIVAFIVIIAIATGGNDKGPSTSGSGSSNSATPQSTKAPKDEIYSVGQAANVDDCEMTLTTVEKSAGGEYDKPQKDGCEFVIVTVTIKNNGKDNLSYNPFYFKMQNSQGQITDMTFTTIDQSTALNSGDLAPGGSVSGTVVFEEPKDDTGLILQYQDNVFADGTKLQFKCS